MQAVSPQRSDTTAAKPAGGNMTPENDRAVGAYLGLAVGDALGATVEFMTPNEIRTSFGVHRSVCGGGWLRLRPGQVTDDTTMSLALGEAILTRGRLSARVAAEAFDAWMRTRPVDIGNTVRRGILHYRSKGACSVPVSAHEAGNGACVRALPVALATYGKPVQEVQAAALAQAHVTHNNPLSDAGTLAVVAMLQEALGGAGREALLVGPVDALVRAKPELAYWGRRRDNPSGYIVETLQAVFQALFQTESFEACLVDVVNRGGDADTTGAIAGMLAGALYGSAQIPAAWRAALDETVARACVRQAVELTELAAGGEGSGQPPAAA